MCDNQGVEYSDANADMMLSAPRQAVLLAGSAAFGSTDRMSEEWRPVVGLETYYEVSDQGHIRRLPRTDPIGRRVAAKAIVNARMSGRYVRVRLRVAGHLTERCVHQMVLEAFVGLRPAGMDGCHNNGDRFDNRLRNLRWDTKSNNALDKLDHGTMARGPRNGWAKLTDDEVAAIRLSVAQGESAEATARAFGVSATHVRRIVRGESWRHLAVGLTYLDALREAA